MISYYKTRKPGARVWLMRWSATGNVGGIGVRAFGRVLNVHGTDDYTQRLVSLVNSLFAKGRKP